MPAYSGKCLAEEVYALGLSGLPITNQVEAFSIEYFAYSGCAIL